MSIGIVRTNQWLRATKSQPRRLQTRHDVFHASTTPLTCLLTDLMEIAMYHEARLTSQSRLCLVQPDKPVAGGTAYATTVVIWEHGTRVTDILAYLSSFPEDVTLRDAYRVEFYSLRPTTPEEDARSRVLAEKQAAGRHKGKMRKLEEQQENALRKKAELRRAMRRQKAEWKAMTKLYEEQRLMALQALEAMKTSS